MKAIICFKDKCPKNNIISGIFACYHCEHKLEFKIKNAERNITWTVLCIYYEHEIQKIIDHNQKIIIDMVNNH